jgi:hypothetical protein
VLKIKKIKYLKIEGVSVLLYSCGTTAHGSSNQKGRAPVFVTHYALQCTNVEDLFPGSPTSQSSFPPPQIRHQLTLCSQPVCQSRQPNSERCVDHTEMAPGTTAASPGGGDMEPVAEEASALRHRHSAAMNGGGEEGANSHLLAEDEAAGAVSVERSFADKPVPSWRDQLTVRAFVVSFFLAVMFSVIVMKLNLTTGIIPSLNVSAGLLGFFFVRLWTAAIERVGLLKQPFTRQENTVIQTCVVAAYDIAFSGELFYVRPAPSLFLLQTELPKF